MYWKFLIVFTSIYFSTVNLVQGSTWETQCQPVYTTCPAKANYKFVVKTYQELIKIKTGNVFMSSFALQVTLMLLALGARGSTRDELITGLQFHPSFEPTQFNNILTSINKTSEAGQIFMANKIYMNNKWLIKSFYKKTAMESFFAEFECTTFDGTTTIGTAVNTFIQEHTHKKVTGFTDITAITADTRLVVVTGLYLQGDWQFAFPSNRTCRFYMSEYSSKYVDTMVSKGNFYYYDSEELSVQYLQLPYKNNKLVMHIILPYDWSVFPEGLQEVEDNLELYLLHQTKFTLKKVHVSLPVFTTKTSIDFKPVLKKLGIREAFDHTVADFKDIASEPELSVDYVYQKTFIEVSATGTEAAAIEADRLVAHPSPNIPRFVANRPFFYYVKDTETGFIVFAGRFVGS